MIPARWHREKRAPWRGCSVHSLRKTATRRRARSISQCSSCPRRGSRSRRSRSLDSFSTKPREACGSRRWPSLLRTPSTYASHLASAFDRAGISAFFLDGVPRVDPAARALGLLLDLAGADLDRAQVAEFLTTARIPYQKILGEDARISPARWDRISARAGIVSGIDQWRTGLRAARESAEEREFDDEVALIDSLELIVERLHRQLADFPETGSWREFLEATLGLLSNWIDRSQLTKERLERLIGPLDRFAPTPTRAQFLARVRELIASQVYREGSLADGRVFVGATSVAAGLRFRVVFVPGLVERRFPSVARPDPLLLDEERAALSQELADERGRAGGRTPGVL